MKLVVGLGNPGKEYEHTRHNVGFLVITALGGDEKLSINKKLNAEVVKTTLNKKRIILARPLTFMNSSGESVQALLNFYKLTPSDLIVVHDDKDIPLGETRIQSGRGAAGHNGVQSIFDHIGTKDIVRIRVGVAPLSHPIGDTAHFVLSNFTAEEQKILRTTIHNVVEEIKQMVDQA